MTRQITRRIVLAVVVAGAALLSACGTSAPTAPSSGCSGTYGGSSTC